MEPVAENAPEIIEAAAQSPLGILALLVLVVGVVAVVLFRHSPDKVKLACFGMIFAGAVGFGLAVLGQAAPDRSEPAVVGPADHPPNPVDTEPASPRAPTPREAPDEPERTTVTLSYAGDLYGCVLDLAFDVGDQSIRPSSNVVQLSGVELGRQPYRIRGTIGCPGIGACQADGAGTLAVEPGAVFDLVWSNDTPGGCSATLTRRM
ncbi:hypothetical protein [Rubrivirga sp. IMCC45206]|uniref:hypothetical protein n=1 Tax=Rubrivirga sp. IMCC45206 TaxID=3391614 RepID=UPI00398FCD3E